MSKQGLGHLCALTLLNSVSKREYVPPNIEELVRSREGNYGCLKPPNTESDAEKIALVEPAWIIPPKLFDDEQLSSQVNRKFLFSFFWEKKYKESNVYVRAIYFKC